MMRKISCNFYLFNIIILIGFCSCRNPNQIAKIKYDMSGCFGSEQSELLVYKLNNDTIAKISTKGKKTQKVTLNSVQIDSLNSFARALKAIKEGGGCTTEESFIADINGEMIKKTIDNCDWYGFYKLKKCLFPVKEQ